MHGLFLGEKNCITKCFASTSITVNAMHHAINRIGVPSVLNLDITHETINIVLRYKTCPYEKWDGFSVVGQIPCMYNKLWPWPTNLWQGSVKIQLRHVDFKNNGPELLRGGGAREWSWKRYWKGTEKALKRYWKGTTKGTRYWKGTEKVLQKVLDTEKVLKR